MIYIILSDVHGNLEAFNAAVDSFPEIKNRRIVSAGDVVGYGANPNECIEKMASIGAVNIKGNHDSAVLGQTDVSFFNANAAAAVSWTKERLTGYSVSYLDGLPLIHEEELFTVVHGTLHEPEEFRYMLTNVEAEETFKVMKKRICFVGHSHVPAMFTLEDKEVSLFFRNKIKLEEGKKYIINAGSIGQPRDGDWRACYCVYDTDKDEIELRRIEYDIKAAQKKILDAGLPKMLADRLSVGR